ncbi:hypothetical protein BXY47_3125 [Dietzia kunjamensis]|nr:hypothetical protein BXY47_3125 [Dietzia kunjamensis]
MSRGKSYRVGSSTTFKELTVVLGIAFGMPLGLLHE